MKRPLRNREVALILLPVLGLGTFACYQQRAEQLGSSHRSDGLFVSSIEISPAKGRFQAMGLSHEIKVTVGHSWPHLGGWGSWALTTPVDPLVDVRQQAAIFGRFKPQDVVAYGGVLTTTSVQNGKPVVKSWCSDKIIKTPLHDGNLIFSHQLALDKIPNSVGEVTFRGLYLIKGQEPLRITRVVRKKGEVSRQPLARNPHGRIASIKAGVFQQVTTSPSNTIHDSSRIDFVISHDSAGKEDPPVLIQNFELHDGLGKIFIPYHTPGCELLQGDSSNQGSNPNIYNPTFFLHLVPTLKTTNPLVLHGTISIDDAWPIPFSVRLPNR